MVDDRFYSDPPRPPNRTPAKWYAECRAREAQELEAATWRKGFKEMLARVHAARGKDGEAAAAIVAALASEDIPLEEMERIGRIVPIPQAALPPPVRPAPAVPHRLPSEQAESAWLREARLEAEAAWRAAFPHTVPQRDLRTAEQIALHESFGELAARAAGLVRDPDSGQKIYRHNQVDEVDIGLYRAGEAAAKRLWPGW
jgi:hypothetical protein